MELLEAIRQRRTIKDFRQEPLATAVVERVLAAGLWAQNHRLTQPWRFTVLGAETHRRLAESFARAQGDFVKLEEPAGQREKVETDALNKILSKPCVVAVSQHLSNHAEQRREDYAAIACALQNIQLAAWADGIGMQWSSGKIIKSPQTYEILGIDPDAEEIIGLLFFGYPASIPAAQPRKALESVMRRLP